MSEGSEWDQHAAGWDTDRAARAYAAAAFASLQPVASGADVVLEGAQVLDFGCGTGLLTELLVDSGSTVHAVDTSPAMLDVLDTKIAERHWRRVRTGMSLPVERHAFDLVVCSSVCAFLDHYPSTVAELVAHLRAGGLFVQWDWERQSEQDHGLTRSEVHATLTAAGLLEVTVSDAFSVTVDDQTMSPIMGHGHRPHETTRA